MGELKRAAWRGEQRRIGHDSTGGRAVADAQQRSGSALAQGPKCSPSDALWHNDVSVVSACGCGDLPLRFDEFPAFPPGFNPLVSR